MNTRTLAGQRGVSLIEALVALAVMAFGMLGVVGMQTTLRSNSDVSKQRGEAVRIAQAAMEDSRAFEQLATGGGSNYADIDDVTGAPVSGVGSNTTFTRSVVVMPATVDPALARMKTVTISVTWQDRNAQTSAVSLTSSIAGVAPELAGSLGLPGDRAPTQRPRGRNFAIPAGAVDQNDGTSVFTPPGAPAGTTWVFNNTTGVITSTCVAVGYCLPADRFLLGGFVQFAYGGLPTAAEAELPTDAALNVGVVVDLTVPTTSTESCFTQLSSTYVAYFCAVPTSTVPPLWSGRTRITGAPIATALTDNLATNYKVCRYTPARNHTPPGGNASHPLDYVNVTGALTNQNFLVISAGDGTVGTAPFECPVDGPNALVNSNTWRHQPPS